MLRFDGLAIVELLSSGLEELIQTEVTEHQLVRGLVKHHIRRFDASMSYILHLMAVVQG